MASPYLTIETPQLPFSYFNPLYDLPVGVVTSSSQARLINKFAPIDIWDRVVILVKQSMCPEEDGRGALSAALEFNAYAKVQVLGYRFITDETLSKEQRVKMQGDATLREAFNVWTDEEVKEAIESAIENTGDPVQVVFRSKRCVDCNQRGDERLMSKYCHMQAVWIHTGISEQCHPGFTEPYHPAQVSSLR